jgi:hypothetical protein
MVSAAPASTSQDSLLEALRAHLPAPLLDAVGNMRRQLQASESSLALAEMKIQFLEERLRKRRIEQYGPRVAAMLAVIESCRRLGAPPAITLPASCPDWPTNPFNLSSRSHRPDGPLSNRADLCLSMWFGWTDTLQTRIRSCAFPPGPVYSRQSIQKMDIPAGMSRVSPAIETLTFI